MIFRRMSIGDLYAIELERHEDERGFFTRTYCEEEFSQQGLNTRWAQCNLSHSDRCGTLRGIHYQAPPAAETKLVRVNRGSVFCAVVDLRRHNSQFGRRLCWTLSDKDGVMLYVPAGCGFGFQTMSDDAELFYQMSEPYRPALARGVRWNDPALDIRWPLHPTCISPRDAALPTLAEMTEPAF